MAYACLLADFARRCSDLTSRCANRFGQFMQAAHRIDHRRDDRAGIVDQSHREAFRIIPQILEEIATGTGRLGALFRRSGHILRSVIDDGGDACGGKAALEIMAHGTERCDQGIRHLAGNTRCDL